MTDNKELFSTADLRSFLDDLRDRGLLQVVTKSVDVTTEIGSLCSQADLPTIFRNLDGYEEFSLVDGLARNRETQAVALGLDCGPSEVISGYAGKLAAGPGETVMVNHSPAKEVIWRDDEARLSRLPIPVPSEGQDIPHMNITADQFLTPCISGAIAVTKNPDTGLQNTFFTMAKVMDDKRIQFFMLPGHTEANVNAWAARGERCPMALVIGCHPAVEMSALYSGDHDGFCELDFAANFLGAPLPMINCESVDLQVPAMAEIVIEGYIDAEKAPYLHLAGHSDTNSPIISLEPFFDVSTITMREKPIYRHLQPSRFTEHHSYAEFMSAPAAFLMLAQQGLTIHDVAVPLKSGANCLIVQMTANTAADVATVFETMKNFPLTPRMTIVVDEDIDIYDIGDVLYALAIRTDPTKHLTMMENQLGMPEPLTTMISGVDQIEIIPNNCWGIDATKPALDLPERRKEFERNKARGEGSVNLQDYLDR